MSLDAAKLEQLAIDALVTLTKSPNEHVCLYAAQELLRFVDADLSTPEGVYRLIKSRGVSLTEVCKIAMMDGPARTEAAG